jgi:hypothetical protein
VQCGALSGISLAIFRRLGTGSGRTHLAVEMRIRTRFGKLRLAEKSEAYGLLDPSAAILFAAVKAIGVGGCPLRCGLCRKSPSSLMTERRIG